MSLGFHCNASHKTHCCSCYYLFIEGLFSVAHSWSTLCNPMDCNTPGFSVLHFSWSLLKFMSIELVMPSNHFILCRSLLLLSSVFPSIGVFSRPEGPGSIPGWGTKSHKLWCVQKERKRKTVATLHQASLPAPFFSPNSICSFHVSGSHFGNSHNISNFFINFRFAVVICDWGFLLSLLYLFGGHHELHPSDTANLINNIYSDCSTDWLFPYLSPPSWTFLFSETQQY